MITSCSIVVILALLPLFSVVYTAYLFEIDALLSVLGSIDLECVLILVLLVSILGLTISVFNDLRLLTGVFDLIRLGCSSYY